MTIKIVGIMPTRINRARIERRIQQNADGAQHVQDESRDNGARTRDLCRDSLTSGCKSLNLGASAAPKSTLEHP